MTIIREETTTPVIQTEGSSSSSGINLLLGVIALIILFYAIFAYGLPMMRSAMAPPQINVPGKVDVNVNK